jgi:hypothetical protein
LLRLASTGRACYAQIEAELALDPSNRGRGRALACRAANPNAAHEAEAWRLLTESDELGIVPDPRDPLGDAILGQQLAFAHTAAA